MLKGRKHPIAAFPSPCLLSRVSAQVIDSSSDKQAWRRAASGAPLSGPKHKVVFSHVPADLKSSQIPPLCPQIHDTDWLMMSYWRLNLKKKKIKRVSIKTVNSSWKSNRIYHKLKPGRCSRYALVTRSHPKRTQVCWQIKIMQLCLNWLSAW